MNNGTIAVGPLLAVVLVLLAGAGAVVVWLGKIGTWHAVLTASARAAIQLTVVSLVITAVLRSGGLTVLFVAVMFGIAGLTSGRRLGRWTHARWAGTAIGAGVAPVLAMLVGSGLVPVTPVAIVPIAGILIGGAMTATTLAGRRALDELRARRGEYEAALALGLLPRDAALLICRPSAGSALVPALDQTRTVGLVTLPGAFVGVLLGGASPLQAGATQLVVLISLLVVEAVAVVVVVELVARERIPVVYSSS
ncbi:ABC transporter permease [Actinocrispum wychmicini]|uniref:ABC transporter permease n=1 Tax=Actinocrispum wychmicini TaxID=1213861 RepID=UPI00104F562F|nr:ABC transporter permease [Actinocrispum wychmicini]